MLLWYLYLFLPAFLLMRAGVVAWHYSRHPQEWGAAALRKEIGVVVSGSAAMVATVVVGDWWIRQDTPNFLLPQLLAGAAMLYMLVGAWQLLKKGSRKEAARVVAVVLGMGVWLCLIHLSL